MILPGTYANGFAPRDGRPLYPELWKGCVGAWNPGLGVSGSTLRDQSGFQNNGTLTNGPTWAVNQGRYALSFDGVDDYVETSKSIIPIGVASISTWVKASSLVEGYFVSEWSPNNMYLGVFSNNWIARSGDGASGASGLLSSSATVSVWTHLCAVRDASTLTLFVNGKNSASTTATSYQGGSGTSLKLARLGGTTYAACNLDDIRIYNRALSAKEIRTLYTRRGIAYEMAPRRRSSVQVTTNRRRRIIIGGNR